jgi:Holliday junction resolvasome RuvABC endonuclease subunit
VSEVYILGCDPGFASFGYCIMQLLPDTERIISVNVIRTKKSNKKQKVLVADDNFRRARAIAAVLREVVVGFQPKAIAAEAFSPPRNASNAAKVALSWGILADIVEDFQLPMVQASPQRIKKQLTDKTSATKEEVQEVLQSRYPGQFDPFTNSTPRGQWEHGFDAAASVVAGLNEDVLRMARRSIG